MSAIFYHSDKQKQMAEDTLKEEQKKRTSSTITTRIMPVGVFTDAEDYHQKYLLQRYPYILGQMDIEPGDELNSSYVATRLNGYVGGYSNLANFEKEKDKFNLSEKLESYVANIVAKSKGPGADC